MDTFVTQLIQGKGRVECTSREAVRVHDLPYWDTEMTAEVMAHFPCCSVVCRGCNASLGLLVVDIIPAPQSSLAGHAVLSVAIAGIAALLLNMVSA